MSVLIRWKNRGFLIKLSREVGCAEVRPPGMVEVLGMQEQFSVRSASIAEDAYKKVGKGREQDAEDALRASETAPCVTLPPVSVQSSPHPTVLSQIETAHAK